MRHAGLIGVVGYKDVTVLQVVDFVIFKHIFDEGPVRDAMEKHRRWNNQTTSLVQYHAGKILGFPDDGGITRAVEMVVHLVYQARDLVAEHLYRDWIYSE